MPQIQIAPKPEKFLKRLLDASLKERLRKAINQLRETSIPPGAIKMHGGENIYRLRVGDYRILYKIEGDIVYVVVIAHRREVYR